MVVMRVHFRNFIVDAASITIPIRNSELEPPSGASNWV